MPLCDKEVTEERATRKLEKQEARRIGQRGKTAIEIYSKHKLKKTKNRRRGQEGEGGGARKRKEAGPRRGRETEVLSLPWVSLWIEKIHFCIGPCTLNPGLWETRNTTTPTHPSCKPHSMGTIF